MKAIVIEAFGPPENLRVHDFPTPKPGSHDILVKVEVAGVCHHDVLHRAGRLPGAKTGVVPGHETAGQVVAIGQEVATHALGDRVVVYQRRFCGQCRNCLRGRQDMCRALGLPAVDRCAVQHLTIDMGVFDFPAREAIGVRLCDEETGLSSLASLNYTGGTSGEPKAVMLGHDNLQAIVQNVVMARAMGPGDVMVNMRPLWPIAGIIVFAHLAAGGAVVLGGRFEPTRMVSLLQRYRAATSSMVLTHLVRLLRDCPPATLRSLDALRSIDVGAAAIPLETFEQALDALGPKIGVLYGLTEASWSCYQPPSALDAPQDVRRARMQSVGRPVFGCDVMIDAANGSKFPEQSGEILIRGAHVMKGYWKRPDLSAQVLKNDWFCTGDLGRIDQTGTVSILGRIKEIIRTGGKSVLPDEIEAALCQHPAVAEVSVVGIPDAEWGELVTAVVVPAPGVDVSEQILKDHCAALLSPHKRPKSVHIVRELPKSHYGKIQRSKVRAAAMGQSCGETGKAE